MSVIKVIEIMANSPVSWEDATKNAIKHASKSLKGIKSAHVQSQSVVVDKNNITEYRVNLKISFEVLD
jgi:flavin-binding protein dodecin